MDLVENLIGVDAAKEALEQSKIPTKVTGTDGKQYPKNCPRAAVRPRRGPLPDAVRLAAAGLRKAAERVQELCADDRFSRHSDQLADVVRSDLEFTIKVCQDLLDLLDQVRDGNPT